MNEKLLEQKAEEKFKTKPLGYEMKPELDIYTDGYIDGATEAIKEAREIIKDLLGYECNGECEGCDYQENICPKLRTRAEQFLKENEK